MACAWLSMARRQFAGETGFRVRTFTKCNWWSTRSKDILKTRKLWKPWKMLISKGNKDDFCFTTFLWLHSVQVSQSNSQNTQMCAAPCAITRNSGQATFLENTFLYLTSLSKGTWTSAQSMVKCSTIMHSLPCEVSKVQNFDWKRQYPEN